MADDQGPSMETRAFIAVVLSLAVMLGYQYFFAPAPQEPVGDPGISAPLEAPAVEPLTGAVADPVEPAVEEESAAEQLVASIGAVGADTRREVTVETERYRLTLDNRGAVISSVVLRDYPGDFGGEVELVVTETGGEPGRMLTFATPDNPAVAEQMNDALYRLTINGVEPPANVRVERPAEIRWERVDASGWSVDKRLMVSPDGYLSDLRLNVSPAVPTPVFVTLGPGLEMHADNTRAGIYLMKGAVLYDGSSVEHINDGDLATGEIRPTSLVWGGVESNYFVGLFAPELPTTVLLGAAPVPVEAADGDPAGAEDAVDTGEPGTRAQFGVLLPSGADVELPLYLGPKDFDILSAAGHDFERAVDYGRFRILARPVAVTLEWLYERTGNYGIAIILATLGVRLMFFPLSQSSMKSMRKMQQLAPQMNAIKAKYKGVKDVEKRQQMNTEVMQLYKDNGVSPLGGCLPMLLQMPVLFGFYAAISVSIVSRQAPFGLWLQDLSKMDPFYVLPLLMGASMYLQQRMSPGTGDPVQQRIFRLMPVMFTFFFLKFPSGLVVYWLVNTVLGIAQQAYVNHQLGAPDAKATPSPKKSKNKGQKGGGATRKKRGKR